MAAPSLEERIAALEAKVVLLEQQQAISTTAGETPWWKRIVGTFKDDPDYDEAIRLGREYRESL